MQIITSQINRILYFISLNEDNFSEPRDNYLVFLDTINRYAEIHSSLPANSNTIEDLEINSLHSISKYSPEINQATLKKILSASLTEELILDEPVDCSN
jgi:hypothetical protein